MTSLPQTTAATKRKRRSKAEPEPQVPDTCTLTLTIRGVDYRARILTPPAGSGVVALVRLRKGVYEEEPATYHVSRFADGTASCDCADCTFREHECKHIKACVACHLLPDAPCDPWDDETRWAIGPGGGYCE